MSGNNWTVWKILHITTLIAACAAVFLAIGEMREARREFEADIPIEEPVIKCELWVAGSKPPAITWNSADPACKGSLRADTYLCKNTVSGWGLTEYITTGPRTYPEGDAGLGFGTVVFDTTDKKECNYRLVGVYSNPKHSEAWVKVNNGKRLSEVNEILPCILDAEKYGLTTDCTPVTAPDLK